MRPVGFTDYHLKQQKPKSDKEVRHEHTPLDLWLTRGGASQASHETYDLRKNTRGLRFTDLPRILTISN